MNRRRTAGVRWTRRLATRLVAISLLVYLAAAIAMTGAEVLLLVSDARHTFERELAALTSTIVPQLQLSVWNLDTGLTETILAAALNNPSVSAATVRLPDGTLFAAVSAPGRATLDADGRPTGRGGSAPFRVPIVHQQAAHEQRAIGTLEIFPAAEATQQLILRTVLLGATRTAILVVLLSIALVIVVNRTLARPLSRLAAGIQQIDPELPGRSQLDLRFRHGDELDVVGTAFNALLERLQNAFDSLRRSEAELRELNATLEARVAERTSALQAAQDRLIESGKMAALGQLVAGISHELNTPIGAVISAARSLDHSINERLPLIASLFGELTEQEVDAVRWILGHAAGARGDIDTRRMRNERSRLESLLATTAATDDRTRRIAEEIAELGVTEDVGPVLPLLQGNHGHLIARLVSELAAISRSAHIVMAGADKAAAAVRSLRIYSRQDRGSTPEEVDIREEIDLAILLHQNAIKQGIEVVRRYGPVPSLCCYRDRLNQVWMNLVGNAIHAMGQRGRLEIAVGETEGTLLVRVRDSGPGIPPEVADQMFTPFFSTKARGEGVGLGLSISRQIVEEHGGTISFVTGPEGTEFTVTLRPELECG
ncbi:ATP-binding protein [Salinispira pacifica]